ncbi:hypothetical protein LTR56_011241 [Elasticomyces elasticus]|nr:hypothetical protein LTR56_011241 [Elasticomyces elasticus]KAK3668315.1 hypothetical protein LTR22_000606 [Elasticomyces elasticus]
MAGPKTFDDTMDVKDVQLGDVESRDSLDVEAESSAQLLKAVRRKVDIKILLWYSFVYLIMRIHVSNVSNVAIINLEQGTGIRKQLGNLSAIQWAWVLSIFYYPYAAFEPASTLLLKRFKPNAWMSRIVCTNTSCKQRQTTPDTATVIANFEVVLGLMEAGYYPDQMALRIAFFYSCGQFSGTISGLLAYAISFMNSAGGLAGWRWVFILEGIPAILCGVYTLFFLPNYPGPESKFLSAAETEFVINDLPKSQPDAKAKTWNPAQAKALLQDPTFYTFTLIWMCHAIGGWGITTVLPTVIHDLGLTDSAVSQLMTMIILITVRTAIVRYIFLTIAVGCSISIYPILWPERIRAARGTTATGLAIGITNVCTSVSQYRTDADNYAQAAAQLSGIVGPRVYLAEYGPMYRVSFAASIGVLAGAIASIGATWWIVRKRDIADRDAASGTQAGAVSSASSESDVAKV